MPIRLKTTAIRSLLLLAALCLIVEAAIVERAFYLRDLQAAQIVDQREARQAERHLLPFMDAAQSDASSLIDFLDQSPLLSRCCTDAVAALKQSLQSSDIAGYAAAYDGLGQRMDAYLAEQQAAINKTKASNKWLPLVLALTFGGVLFVAWLVLQRRFVQPIVRLQNAISRTGSQGPFDYESQADDPGEVADLASSFAALMSRLNSELAGRDLVLREAKDMVRRETQRLSGEVAQLFDESPLPIFTLDRLGKVMSWNRAIADLSDIPETEASGGTLPELALVSADAATFNGSLARVLDEGEAETLPVTLRRRDNANVVVSVHMVPRKVYGGEVVGVNCFGHELGDGLAQAARAVEKQQTTHFSELASSAAHQLNQPLQKMRLYLANAQNRLRVQVLDRDVLTEKLKGVDEQLNLAAEIIEHLRDFGRPIEPLENGFQLATVVERCLDLSRGNLVDRGIRLRYENELREELASGHPLQVEKPLIALLSNAREAITDGASGHPQINVSLSRRGPDAAQIVVADNGPGIATDAMKRIFEPFYTTRNESRHLGLGLAMARTMIGELGGDIALETGGGWTTATVTIPLKECESGEPV